MRNLISAWLGAPVHIPKKIGDLYWLFLPFNFVEVLDGIPGSAQLNQNDGGFLDSDVPILLQIEN